jgi:putative photosynthetic complex assembly protein
MSGEFVNETFPRGPLLGATALVAFALLATAAARLGTVGGRAGEPVAARDPVAIVSLRFADREDGAVLVVDSESDAAVATIEPGTGGFLRATLRALSRERKLSGIGAAVPFELRRYADGRLELHDTGTERNVYLDAFGPTNADAFSALLVMDGTGS